MMAIIGLIIGTIGLESCYWRCPFYLRFCLSLRGIEFVAVAIGLLNREVLVNCQSTFDLLTKEFSCRV